jgi:hypothetical protein
MPVRLADFPQLKLIAWNRNADALIEEEEAFALYEREWRWVEQAALLLSSTTRRGCDCKNAALKLAQQGGDVTLTYHNKQAQALAVVADIEATGKRADGASSAHASDPDGLLGCGARHQRRKFAGFC